MNAPSETKWQVVVRYDSPHAGMWYGPAESKADAEDRLILERSRVHGKAWIEQVKGTR